MLFHLHFFVKSFPRLAPAALILFALATVFPLTTATAEQGDDPNVAAPEFIPEIVPKNIAGMTLVNLIDGAEAARIIDRMHQGNVATLENFIATYQGLQGAATYYVSLYDTPQQATKDMEEMAEIMAREGHGFSHLMRREANGTVFYMALGQGQAHYFFARDTELVWLAVDKGIAEQALEDILR